MVGIIKNASQVLGRPPPVSEIRVNYPEPPHSSLYDDFIGVPVRFDHLAFESS
jgi:hypothetical protein